jgi:REP element-mobilizing transposase RayT
VWYRMRALKGRHKNLSHAFVKNHIHLVFGVKDRRRKIDQELLPELWPYIAGICRNQGMAAIAVNGMNDHGHVLFHLPPVMSLADAVRLIKRTHLLRGGLNNFALRAGLAPQNLAIG